MIRRNFMIRIPAFLLLVLLNFSLISQNESENVILVHKVENLVFDGKLDESFWKELDPFKFIQFQPHFSDEISEKLEVYLVYDNKYLYLTGRLYVSDPSFIRGQTYKRDGESAATDYFGMVVDSYNDKENGMAFFTSPTGFRYDASISDDASDENSISTSWNTYWDAMTHVTLNYYDVEIRIPWASLKFEPKDNKVVMGISIWRYIAAKNEMCLYPSISPDLGELANWKPSMFQEVIFENISSSNPVYITPYALTGNQRQNTLNDDESAFQYEQNFEYNAGLDVKYNITSNLTLDLTANTDFAQVESDDEQINLSRYALFRPEKRQFFQERSSLFNFQFNHINHLFYSRNIGIEDGEAVPILGGMRLTGKIGDMDIGVINMQTAQAGTPFFQSFDRDKLSNNFSVLRLKQQVINPYSYVGGMVTHKMDFKGDFNTAYGLDAVFRLWGNDYLTLKWAQTFEDSLDKSPLSLDPTRFYIGMEKRRFSGLNYRFSFGSTGKNYNPALGFVTRNNYIFSDGNLRYGYIFDKESRWQNINIHTGFWGDNNYDLERIDQASVFGGISLLSKKAWGYRFNINYNYDELIEVLELSDDISIPVGRYHYTKFSFSFNTPYNSRFGVNVDSDFGKFFDGIFNSFEFEPRWNPNAHLEMAASYELNHINFNEREQLLTSHILKVRALYMLNAKLSLSCFLQYNNESDLFISNLKFRYNPKEGNDLYIVFNEVLNGERDRLTPRYPMLNTEVFALKYTYTFKIN